MTEAFELHALTGYLVRRAQQAHVAAWNDEVSTDITSVQFGVLNVLRRQPGASQKDLCDELDLDQSTIADIVQRLQRRGLITRVRADDDRRRNVLDLTVDGRRKFDEMVPGVRRVDQVMTAGLSSEESARLRQLLELLLAAPAVHDAVHHEDDREDLLDVH
jgi:DNA-binding MarR family transcriptional regulator